MTQRCPEGGLAISEGHWCMMGPHRSQTGPALPGRTGCTARGEGLGGYAPPVFTLDMGRRSVGERSGWGRGCLGVLRGRYLHSVFARHPRHTPFSLEEETEKR